MVHQIANTFDHHPAIIFTALLRSMGFLLKLFQRGGILFCCAWLIELRLQEIDHLVNANIATTDGRQQFIQLVEVVTRKQLLFSFFQANANMFQFVIQNLTTRNNVFVTILLTEPAWILERPRLVVT